MKLIKKPFIWVPAALIALAVAWWLGSPLFLVRMVDEAPPMAAGEMGKESMGGAMQKDTAVPMSAAAEGAMASNAAEPATEQPMMSGLSGAFRDADSLHKASGTAKVIEVAPGQLVLRFEDFNVTNGPDLFVVLTRPGAPARDGVRLGALKGSQGSQNYEIPAGVDLTDLSRVVIWCRAFNVTFGTADLAQP